MHGFPNPVDESELQAGNGGCIAIDEIQHEAIDGNIRSFEGHIWNQGQLQGECFRHGFATIGSRSSC